MAFTITQATVTNIKLPPLTFDDVAMLNAFNTAKIEAESYIVEVDTTVFKELLAMKAKQERKAMRRRIRNLPVLESLALSRELKQKRW